MVWAHNKVKFVVVKMSGRCTHRSGDNFVTIGGSRPGHCPGEICAYFFEREFSCDIAAPLRMLPSQVTWQF